MNDDATTYERHGAPASPAEARFVGGREPRLDVGKTKAPKARWGRRLGLLLGALLILLGFGAALWLLPRPSLQGPRASRFVGGGAQPVVAAPAVSGAMPILEDGLGTVTSLATVTVRPQVSGPLVSVAFREGQSVKKGDPLATIDPRPFQLALDQAQAQLLKDQALLQDARLDFARYSKLLKQDSISRQQRDTQEYLVHQYEGTVKADQALVDTAKLNLSYTHILAPVGGRVGLRQVDPGNYVQTNDANGIVIITQIKPISVVFTLPEDALGPIMQRLNAGAALPVLAYDRRHTTVLARGSLASVDNQIDPGTGTVKLRADFANDDESLFPNQFVNAELVVDTLQNVTLVPSAAIQRGAPGTYVYVVKDDSTVTVRPVTLGPENGQKVTIRSGLKPGERVVIDGADRLREGAKVSLQPAGGGPQPFASAPGAVTPAAAKAPAAPAPGKTGAGEKARSGNGRHRRRSEAP